MVSFNSIVDLLCSCAHSISTPNTFQFYSRSSPTPCEGDNTCFHHLSILQQIFTAYPLHSHAYLCTFQFYSRSSFQPAFRAALPAFMVFQFYSRSSAAIYISPRLLLHRAFNSIVDLHRALQRQTCFQDLFFQFYSRSSRRRRRCWLVWQRRCVCLSILQQIFPVFHMSKTSLRIFTTFNSIVDLQYILSRLISASRAGTFNSIVDLLIYSYVDRFDFAEYTILSILQQIFTSCRQYPKTPRHTLSILQQIFGNVGFTNSSYASLDAFNSIVDLQIYDDTIIQTKQRCLSILQQIFPTCALSLTFFIIVFLSILQQIFKLTKTLTY